MKLRPWPLLLLLALLVMAGPRRALAQVAEPAGRTAAGAWPAPGVYLQDDPAARAAGIEWLAGSQAHFSWRQLEPEPGRYDFSALDRWLAAAAAGHQRGALAVWLRCADGADGVDACAPAWTLDWDPVLASGRPRLNYLDGRVRDEIGRLVTALARRYAGDTRLSHVLIGPGYEGSTSPCPPALDAPDATAQCAAYGARYAGIRANRAAFATPWEEYLDWLIRAYGAQFQAAGGPAHVALQATITGKYPNETERATVVQAALAIGAGLHDLRLAPDFLDGDRAGRLCAQDWQPGQPGYSAALAYGSHWAPLEQLWPTAPVSFQLERHPAAPESALTGEEAAWWSVLNALDKHGRVLYVPSASLGWSDAWRFFARYAGRSADTTPDAWIALRDSRPGWCADRGDYEWYLRANTGSAGASPRSYTPAAPGGRAGQGWQGAFSRGTDVAAGTPSLYFDLDDAFAFGGENIVSVEVTYWDGTPDMAGRRWEMAYDAAGMAGRPAGVVALTGTDRWLTHSFVLLDATFRNRLPDAAGKPGSDLRLSAAGPGDVRFHMVRVQLLAQQGTPPARRALPITATPRPGAGMTGAPAVPQATPPATALPFTTTIITPPTATAVPFVHLRPDRPQAAPASTPQPRPGTAARPLPTPLSGQAELVCTQGLEPAGETRDTFLAEDQAARVYGVANTLVVGGGSEALLYFDLGSLPANARVVDAWLELTVLGRNRSGTVAAALYPLLRRWDDREASWGVTGAGDVWSQPGLGSGSDYEPAPVAVFTLPESGVLQVRVTTLARAWAQRPAQNYGLLLRADSSAAAEYYLASSEWRALGYRPRLRLRLAPIAGPDAAGGAGDAGRALASTLAKGGQPGEFDAYLAAQ